MSREDILRVAALRRGIPYRIDPPPDGVNNLDCSLYVLVTFKDAGHPFQGVRTAEQIRQACVPIGWNQVQAGDLLFFEHTYEPSERPGPDGHVASHIGISLGAGTKRMWDSHSPGGVQLTNINTDYWQEHLFEPRRAKQLIGPSPPPSLRDRVLAELDASRARIAAEMLK